MAPAGSLQEGSRCARPSWACREGVGPLGAEREPTLSRTPVLRALPPAPSGALLPQGEEKAQLQTELPRDMVAGGYPPHDHRDRLTCFADLIVHCRAGVVCRVSPEEQQRNLETSGGLFEAHVAHDDGSTGHCWDSYAQEGSDDRPLT